MLPGGWEKLWTGSPLAVLPIGCGALAAHPVPLSLLPALADLPRGVGLLLRSKDECVTEQQLSDLKLAERALVLDHDVVSRDHCDPYGSHSTEFCSMGESFGSTPDPAQASRS